MDCDAHGVSYLRSLPPTGKGSHSRPVFFWVRPGRCAVVPAGSIGVPRAAMSTRDKYDRTTDAGPVQGWKPSGLRFLRRFRPARTVEGDQTGVPIHFHSSTMSGAACWMSWRILPRVFPRQSPSSAIRFEISSDAGWLWLASDFFMVSSWKFQISFNCKTLEASHARFQNDAAERSGSAAARQRRPLQPVVRRHCALGAGVQHGWLSPTQRTERIRIPKRARQPPRTVALPRPAGPAR